MEPLSISYLTTLFSSSPPVPSSTLVDLLSDLESDATLLFDNLTISNDDLPLIQAFYSGFIVALLLDDDLTEARFLTHRFPPSLSKTNSELSDSRNLLRAVWQKDYPLIYQLLENAHWPEPVEPLIARYTAHFRASTFTLLSRAYAALPPRLAASYLGIELAKSVDALNEDEKVEDEGLSEEDVVAQFTRRGWGYDANTKMLLPKPPAEDMNGPENDVTAVNESMARLIGLVGSLGE